MRALAIFLLSFLALPARATVWYVNDTSLVGDSFSSAVGNDANNGLTILTPKRNITAVTPLLTAGDTIFIDAGTFDSIVTVSTTESAAIRIDTDNIFVIGVDSLSTIIDPIGGNSIAGLYGIYADTQTGLTIKNLAVTGAKKGINFYNVDVSTVTGVSSSSNGSYGIYIVVNSDSNTVSNNTFSSNLLPGIFLDRNSNNNTLSNNTANSNTDYGILLNASSNNNTLSNNTTNSNTNDGIVLSNSSNNTVSGNTANSNLNSGIALSGGSNNTVLHNTANANKTFAGIYLSATSNNRVVGNTVDSNAQHQIWFELGSSSDTFVKNNMKASPSFPDSYVWDVGTVAANKFTLTRNFWQTTDSGVIRNRIWPANARDSIIYTPFRLGIVDTAPLADTVAPKAPNTITATTIDATRIRIDWGAVSTSEEAETVVGLNGYRVYRSNQADSTFWELRGAVNNATTTYTDSGMSVGQGFYYRVTSVDNHTPFENQSFYSDSIAYDTTATLASISGIASAPTASPISRTGPDSAVIALTLRCVNPDTVIGIIVRLAGNIPSTDVDTLSLYRDGNRNGRYEAGQDTLISLLNFSSADTFNATGLTVGINGADSFIVTISLEDTASFGDTFTASIPVNGLAMSNVEIDPGSPFLSAGIWTVNSGVDTTAPNIWYVNDTSAVGDSFTAAMGNSSNNGLTPVTPKRFLNDIENLLSSGDTILIDAGIYNEATVVVLNSAPLWVIGVDSMSSIIDFNDITVGGNKAVTASNLLGITLQDFRITRGYCGVIWTNVDTSIIRRVRVDSCGQQAFRLAGGSDQNTIEYNLAENNTGLNGYGFSLYSSSNNALTSNVSMKNRHGFFAEVSSSNNIFSQNISSSNLAHGFSLDNSNGNAYRDNVVSNNLGNGFSVAASSTSNVFAQNYIDSNLVGAIYIGNTANSDTFTKNVFILSPSNPDSGVQNVTANSHTFIRNWWGTTDTIAIKTKMWGSGRDLVIYTPFRLGSVDTVLLADTVASKAPDTVTATTIDSTRIRIDWSAVSTSEEAETVVGLNLYRVYRATTADSSFWELRGTVNNSTTTYADSGLSLGQGFFYRITSADNHTPFENESFYSDSIAYESTFTLVSIIGIASAPTASPISRTGPDSAVIAFTVRAANPDTVNGIIVRLAGNTPSTDVDTLSLYRDGNRNGRYEAGQDTLISTLNFSSTDTYNATGLTAGLSGADSFIVTISLEDTANFGDTFTASIPVNGLATSNAGAGPGSPFSSAGTWTVNSGVDTTGANIWYVNDTSAAGDSFTSAIGNDANNGLTIQTPKRNITAVTPLLSAGDTIYIDAGTFDSIVAVSATETAAIRIDTNTIWVIGVDSTKTIIDPSGASSTKNLYGVYADTQTGLTIRNIAVTGAYEGIYFFNVDLSAITGDSLGVNGDSGIYLAYGSDTNTVSNNTANSNASGGIYLNSSSNNNTVSNNIVNSNVYGIVLRASLNNMVSGNNANSNTTGNIQLNSSSNNNTVSGNTADSSINGILLKLTADANTISGNTANSNSSTGIGLDASSNNLVSDNTANLNAFSGIYIPGISNNNTVSGNTMNSNPQYQFTIAGAATTDTFQKNNMKASLTLPESYVNNISTIATSKFIMTRNFWQTRDSGVIRNRIWPANARDSVVYTPFRLGIVDTAPLADTVAPKAPDTVTATTIDSARIRIDWGVVSTSEEAETVVGLNGYRVYRSNQVDSTFWELRGQVGNSTTTYTDSGLSVGQSFFYRVTSLDNHAPFENEAFYSDSIALASDSISPTSFSLVSPAHGLETTSASISFSWTASSDSVSSVTYRFQVANDSGFSSLRVDSPGLSGTSLVVTLGSNAWYAWRVIASDSSGNSTVTGLRVFLIDNVGPSAPTLLAPTADETRANGNVTFTWAPSTDSLPANSSLALSARIVAAYRIQTARSATFAVLVDSSAVSDTTRMAAFTDTGIFYWRVMAVDSLGNGSAWAGPESFSRPPPADTTPPLPPFNFKLTQLDTGAILFTWEPSLSLDMLGGGYRVYWNAGVDTFPDQLLQFTAHDGSLLYRYLSNILTTDSTYRFRVQAVDATGNAEQNSNIVQVTILGMAPPYAQTNIITPHAGNKVNRTGGVEVVARVTGTDAQKAAISSLRFQYRATGLWTDMAVSSREINPAPFNGTGNVNIHWNASAVTLGEVQIRAVPTFAGGFAPDTMAGAIAIELVGNKNDATVSTEIGVTPDTVLQEQVVTRGRADTVSAHTPNSRKAIDVFVDSGVAPRAPDTAQVKLRLSATPTSPVDTSTIKGSPIDLVIDLSFSDSGQPSGFVDLFIPLDIDAENKITIGGKKFAVSSLEAWTYSRDTGRWEKIEVPNIVNGIARIRARHFSFFTLVAPVAPVTTLSAFTVYPNPFKPNDADATNGVEYNGTANTGITFENLPANSLIRIYTALGEQVAEARVDATGGVQWDVRNGRGERVASGVYIYIATTPSNERRTGKLVVIR